jgi:hypothetical protein
MPIPGGLVLAGELVLLSPLTSEKILNESPAASLAIKPN